MQLRPLRAVVCLSWRMPSKVTCAEQLSRDFTARYVGSGKKPSWKGPPGIDAEVCRRLNDDADREAGNLMELRRSDSHRSRWFRALEEARQWTTGAIRISAEASEQYLQFLTRS